MTTIVKIDAKPSVAKPVEGVHYNVLQDAPQAGDSIRIRDGSTEVFIELAAPPPPHVPKPVVLDWGALAVYLIGLLGGGASGRAALGAIIKSCQASAQGADNFFAVYFQGQTTFTKVEFTAVLADVSTSIVSGPAKTSVANSWPEA